MSLRLIFVGIALFIGGLVTACDRDSGPASPVTQDGRPEVAGARELPTLYPTATPIPAPSPAATIPPRPSTAPATQAAFNQLVVDVTYSIPILGLERRIIGNVAGEIEVIDESNGASVTLKNRPGVVVEMQQALPRATLASAPDDCQSCVLVEYALPLTDQSGQGWLKDVQLLASLENYTAAILGPHFPPGTVAGLRREATPFEVAHSAAITAEGELWTWLATDSQVPVSTAVEGIEARTASEMDPIDWTTLQGTYGHTCYQGGGGEALVLDSPDGLVYVEVRCPELYLPGQLVPIYSTLSDAIVERLEGGDVVPPELPMTLDTLVLYQRADGAVLDLQRDGTLGIVDADGVRYTSTLTMTQALSLTTALVDSSLLETGPSAIFAEEPGNVILMRGNDDVYELSWNEEDEVPITLLQSWDRVLERVIREVKIDEEERSTPVPTATSAGDGS